MGWACRPWAFHGELCKGEMHYKDNNIQAMPLKNSGIDLTLPSHNHPSPKEPMQLFRPFTVTGNTIETQAHTVSVHLRQHHSMSHICSTCGRPFRARTGNTKATSGTTIPKLTFYLFLWWSYGYYRHSLDKYYAVIGIKHTLQIIFLFSGNIFLSRSLISLSLTHTLKQ